MNPGFRAMMATKKVKRYADGGEIDGPDTETFPVYMASAKGEDLPAMEAEPVKAKPKSKMVTKEELAKSGLSLRDYLNKQQGLTRRGGNTSSTGSAGAKGPTADELDAYKTVPKASASRSGILSRMREADKGIKGVRSTESAPSTQRSITRVNPDDLKGSMKGMGGASGFAKGGAVRSASQRADGCAQRGKTRA
jgi:hypothetical protein